jgi:hypothetical protein
VDRGLLFKEPDPMRRPGLAISPAIDLLPLVIVAGFVAGGCITPSIPIPPPDPERMTFVVTGDTGNTSATFSYPADINYRNSIVFLYNRDRGLGIIEATRPDGSIGPTRPVSAAIGDQIVVTFQREDQTMSTCIRLREGPQSSTPYCSL